MNGPVYILLQVERFQSAVPQFQDELLVEAAPDMPVITRPRDRMQEQNLGVAGEFLTAEAQDQPLFRGLPGDYPEIVLIGGLTGRIDVRETDFETAWFHGIDRHCVRRR